MEYRIKDYILTLKLDSISVLHEETFTKYTSSINDTNKKSDMSLEVFNKFIIKCLNNEPNFSVKIIKKNLFIEILFHGSLSDFYEIKHSLNLNEIVMNETDKLMHKLNIVENKVKELEKNTGNSQSLDITKELQPLKLEVDKLNSVNKNVVDELQVRMKKLECLEEPVRTLQRSLKESQETVKISSDTLKRLDSKIKQLEEQTSNSTGNSDTYDDIIKKFPLMLKHLKETETKVEQMEEPVKKIQPILKHLKEAEDNIKILQDNTKNTSFEQVNSKILFQERQFQKEIKSIQEQYNKSFEKLELEIKNKTTNSTQNTNTNKLFDKLQLELKNKDTQIKTLETELNKIKILMDTKINKITADQSVLHNKITAEQSVLHNKTTTDQIVLQNKITEDQSKFEKKIKEYIESKMEEIQVQTTNTQENTVLIYRNYTTIPFRYETINSTDTEIDLSNYNNNMIIWNNLSKIVNLETLIINDTPKTIDDTLFQTIYQLDTWCSYTTSGEKLLQSNTFDIMNFINVKTLMIRKKHGKHQSLGNIPNIPFLENLILIDFNYNINIDTLKVIKTLQKIELLNTTIQNVSQFKSYCQSNNITLDIK